MFKVAAIVGSLRADSVNRRLALALARLARPQLRIDLVRIDDLPVYNQDLEGELPPAALRLKAEIEAAEAVLFLTPEHNRSISTALKNAIDWASRPYGRSSWQGKPAAVAGASAGAIGTAVAQQHLRTILAHLDLAVLGQPEVFIAFRPGLVDDSHDISDAATRLLLEGFVSRFHAWIATQSRQEPEALAA